MRWLLLCWPAVALAQVPSPAPLAVAVGDLDGDGRPERARLERDGSVRVDDPDGRERGRATLPSSAGSGALLSGQLRLVPVEDRVVLHARAPLPGRRAVELVAQLAGALETLYAGRTGPVGDGERAERLRVDEAGVVRYQSSPGMTRCDGDEQLFPERYDFRSSRFRPVESEVPAGPPLRATTATPPGLAAAPLGLFHLVAESTSDDAERRADRLAAPHELEDGSPATVWSGGRGAWVTARAQAGGHELRALRIVPGPGPTAPRALALLLDGDRAFTVALPPSPSYVVFPAHTRAACVSVVIAEPAAGGTTSLAELALFTDLDAGDGIDRLVAEVTAGRTGAADAGRMLGQLGAPAARAIGAALDRAGEGRRRLLGVLAALGVPEAAPPLGHALEIATDEERPIVIDGLIRLGAPGGDEALRVYRDRMQAPDARADAAAVLGRVGGHHALALLEGAGRGEPAVRAATRRALDDAVALNGGLADAATAALGEAGCSDGARSGELAHVVGQAGRRVERSRAVAALEATWRCAADFELKLRLVRAMGAVGAPELAAPLAEAARAAPDEVLRWAAVESATSLDGDAGLATVRAAAGDRDPRVRRAALAGLASHGGAESERALVAALEGDRWPLVRIAAAEALAGSCGTAPSSSAPSSSAPSSSARALAGALLDDPVRKHAADASEAVRRAALLGLDHCKALPASTTAAVLRSHEQPLAVRELAAALLAKSGDAGAGPTLAAALDDVLSDPAADERSAGLAVAITRGLGRVGDRSRPVLEALGAASNEPLSPSVRATAMESIGQLCPDGAGVALQRGAADPDPAVRRAAKAALGKCRR